VQSERGIPRRASHGAVSKSAPLDVVSESDLAIHRGMRILKPVLGPDTWQSGRRYLIVPATLSSCQLDVLRVLSGVTRRRSLEDTAFGIVELGKATATYVGESIDHFGWSECHFELRQNYLFEYDVCAPTTGVPRGMVHLSGAHAYAHADFSTALELQFFGSPCSRTDRRTVSDSLGDGLYLCTTIFDTNETGCCYVS
jgi:hypothetical protein